MKLRMTGIATVLALAVCLALLTTGAFAQSMQKHVVLGGGGPLPMAPAVVAPRVAPRMAPRVAPRVAPAAHAVPNYGIGVATSHALSGGFVGNHCGSHCGHGLTGTSASGTALGLGFGSGTGLGFGASNTLGQHGTVAPVAAMHGGNWLNSLGDLGSLGIFH